MWDSKTQREFCRWLLESFFLLDLNWEDGDNKIKSELRNGEKNVENFYLDDIAWDPNADTPYSVLLLDFPVIGANTFPFGLCQMGLGFLSLGTKKKF